MLVSNRNNRPTGNYDGFRTHLLIGELTSGSREISIQITEVQPGSMQFLHAHPQAQCYYIIEGRGRMIIADEQQEVGQGDAVFIPGDARHGIENCGEGELVYLTANRAFGEHREAKLWPE